MKDKKGNKNKQEESKLDTAMIKTKAKILENLDVFKRLKNR